MGGYYIDTVSSHRELLDRLQRPLVDIPMVKYRVDRSRNGKSYDISRFMPTDNTGMAPKTDYSMSGSITGRLTVSRGPNILTLKKSYRKILKSRFKDGSIVQADISSLEPRIALAFAGKLALPMIKVRWDFRTLQPVGFVHFRWQRVHELGERLVRNVSFFAAKISITFEK